jgi:hypothetical protein
MFSQSCLESDGMVWQSGLLEGSSYQQKSTVYKQSEISETMAVAAGNDHSLAKKRWNCLGMGK